VLDAAYAAGCTFWDTANVYGDSEDLIGKWCAASLLDLLQVHTPASLSTHWWIYRFKLNPEKRSKIFLATKFGFTMTGARGDPEFVKEQCEQSLARLGVDYIDLYYQHRWVAPLIGWG
jgi:aryl-alcohol dehydrogenase-like predicted oxidoreductase